MSSGGLAAVIALFMVAQNAPEEPEEIIVRPSPDVVLAVRDLARLETASYHMERVMDLTSRQRHLFGMVEADDSIILVAAADVVAGVDLERLRPEDVEIDTNSRAVTITLPAVEVFSSALDNEHTYVHSRQTDLLARRRESLETQARQQAERRLTRAAIAGGLLERAERNARQTVRALVQNLGYERVEVRFREPELRRE